MNTARSLCAVHDNQPDNDVAAPQRTGPLSVRRCQVFSGQGEPAAEQAPTGDPIARALDRALSGLREEEGERWSNRAVAQRMGVDEKRIREWRAGTKVLAVKTVWGMGEKVWERFVEEMGK